jgi:hypothetical protein
MVDGFLADSTAVDKYLSSIAWLSNSDFIDEAVLEKTEPDYILSIEGNNMPVAIKIKAFKTDTVNMYGITSSINEGTYFSGKQSGLMNKIFIAKEQLFKKEETKK